MLSLSSLQILIKHLEAFGESEKTFMQVIGFLRGNKLQQYFPMIWSREEVRSSINADALLHILFLYWETVLSVIHFPVFLRK